MRDRGLPAVVGWFAAVLFCWPGMSGAATYELQVASLPEPAFMFFVKDRTLPRIEAFLDDKKRSKFVLFHDRQPQALELRGPEQPIPFPDNVTLPKRNDPWGITSWHGKAGQPMVFRVRGRQSSYQKLRRVAVQMDGILSRFPVRRIPAFSPRPVQVPVTSASYLAHAMESGTFLAWAERRAASHDGLSVIVGRHPDKRQSDTVYLLVRMPRDGKSYKVVLGWQNFEYESGHGNDQGGQDR